MEVFLNPQERIDDLQRKGYRIIQHPDKFCFGMDAVLLSAFANAKEEELIVVAFKDGKSSVCESFSVAENTLTVDCDCDCFYVILDKKASCEIGNTSTSEINANAIVEQFKADNEILKQLQTMQTRTLRGCDEIGYLPESKKRIKTFLSFDENGNPVCEVGVDEFAEAKNSTNLAVQASKNAQAKAEEAQRKAETAQAKAELAQAKAETAQSKAELAQNIAENAAKSSAQSAEEAQAKVETLKTQHNNDVATLEEQILNAQYEADAAYGYVVALAGGSAPFDSVMIRIQDSEKFVKLTFRKDENGVYPVYEEV